MSKRKLSTTSDSSHKRARHIGTAQQVKPTDSLRIPGDSVYCSECHETEGEDFLLCDACDYAGGMHRRCANLDRVPEGFWACSACKIKPTVESAIRQVLLFDWQSLADSCLSVECAAELQVLHKHSESGLTEKKLLKKAKALLPIGSWGPAELSKGLQQALLQKEDGFDHEYKVVKFDQKYHLVQQPEADAEDDQQVVSDSEDEGDIVHSSHTLGSKDDAPRQPRSFVKRSTRCQQSSAMHTTTVKGNQLDSSRQPALKSTTADSCTAASTLQRRKDHEDQKFGIADHTADRDRDYSANKPVVAATGHTRHSKAASGEGSAKRTAANSTGDSSPAGKSWKQHVSSASVYAPAALSEHLQPWHQYSAPTDSQYPQNQAGQGSSGGTLPQQQLGNKQKLNNSADVHDLVNSALVGLAQHKSWSVTAQTGLVSAYAQFVKMQRLKAVPAPEVSVKVEASKAAEEGLDSASLVSEAGAMLVVNPSARQQLGSHTAQMPSATVCQGMPSQQVAPFEAQRGTTSTQLSSPKATSPGVEGFMSIMSKDGVMTPSQEWQRNSLFRATSQVAELSSHAQSFKELLGTLDEGHAAKLVQQVHSRMQLLATSRAVGPDRVEVFLQMYWQSLASNTQPV